MRATQPVGQPGGGNVVPLVSPVESAHAPLYSERSAGNTETSAAPDLFRHGANLLQWAVLFGILGALVAGARWWSGADAAPESYRGPLITRRLEMPTVPSSEGAVDAGVAAMSGAVTDGTDVAATLDVDSTEGADATMFTVAANDSTTQAVPAQTLRAPADVPYPRKLHQVEPTLPGNASAQRGIVVLSLLIDATGDVADVEVLRGLDANLDRAVVAAARQWKFEPTVHEGRPVAVRGNFSVPLGY